MQKEPGARIQEPGSDVQKSCPLEGYPLRRIGLGIDHDWSPTFGALGEVLALWRPNEAVPPESWILPRGYSCDFSNSFGKACQVIPPTPAPPTWERDLDSMG
jgi:hypothetical protein